MTTATAKGEENDGDPDPQQGQGNEEQVVYGTAYGSVIQSVYIDKDALGKEPPEKVTVVISAE